MTFINENFMLQTETARQLYHQHAKSMPIIDYHCHLSPKEIAENIQFQDITQLWLGGDHYKWRALRANGVSEDYITGNRSSWEKFQKWAETVPYTMRNPLYHWTHLELKRVFDIDKLLSPATAREIFEECNAMLAKPEFRGQALIRKFNVDVVCTTDDPADDLGWHKMIQENPFGTKVLPAWRPDKAMAIENPKAYKEYLEKLEQAAGMKISSYADLQDALQKRHDFFASRGCKLSDHGMDTFYAADYKEAEVEAIFKNVLAGKVPQCLPARSGGDGCPLRLGPAVPRGAAPQQQRKDVQGAGAGHRLRCHRRFAGGGGGSQVLLPPGAGRQSGQDRPLLPQSQG